MRKARSQGYQNKLLDCMPNVQNFSMDLEHTSPSVSRDHFLRDPLFSYKNSPLLWTCDILDKLFSAVAECDVYNKSSVVLAEEGKKRGVQGLMRLLHYLFESQMYHVSFKQKAKYTIDTFSVQVYREIPKVNNLISQENIQHYFCILILQMTKCSLESEYKFHKGHVATHMSMIPSVFIPPDLLKDVC